MDNIQIIKVEQIENIENIEVEQINDIQQIPIESDVNFLKGKDGFSPIITVEQKENCHTVIVQDNKKVLEFTILDGEKGQSGKDGSNGKDGYTPIKGIDYFTKEEINSFKEQVTPIKGIDYTDGKDGNTPIKGTDYFTNDEIAQFKQEVKPIKNIDYFDGANGQDGYTPIKGIDYYTPEEIETIKKAIQDGIVVPTKTSELENDSDYVSSKPLMSKTYNDIRYSETLMYNSTYPYVKFGEIKPIDYNKPCSITIRLKVSVNNTDGSLPIAINGEYLTKYHFAQDVTSTTNLAPRYRYIGFENFSKFANASYKPIYNLCIRGLNNNGFVAQNTIPFGWVRGGSDYKYNTCTRNITVEIVECDNCNVTLVDEIVHYKTAEFLGDGVVANYDTITSLGDMGTIGGRHTGDYNTDTYYRLNDNGNKQIVDYPLYRYDLILEKLDGTFAPLRTNNKSGGSVNGGIAIPNVTSRFMIGGRIMYYSTTTTIVENGLTTGGDIDITCDGRYMSTNTKGTALKVDGEPFTTTNAKSLYLKVKDNGDLTFSLDDSLPADLGYHITQQLPTTNDGYLYIQLGRMTNHLYQWRLYNEHPIYYHDGEKLIRY